MCSTIMQSLTFITFMVSEKIQMLKFSKSTDTRLTGVGVGAVGGWGSMIEEM